LSIVRIARLVVDGKDRWSRLDGDRAVLLDAAPWDGGRDTGDSVLLAGALFSCPVSPKKIFGIGKNYRAHANEMGGEVPIEPLVFAKATSSLVGPGSVVLLPPESTRVDYEGELGVVIGSRCRRVTPKEALSFVFGYVPVCDVTARDLQKKDGQWTRAKGFDTFCPVGPHIETDLDPTNVLVETRVNGAVRQSGNTSLMIYPCAFLVRWISRMMTLYPGDVIATGTPAGVGPLLAGDAVEVSVAGIGVLRNPVHAPQPQ
jgi:2-keto-4-pentenoate hydratase/2-oxohepta-3-ene-1,7-dioic acid hydratase in catechol pathway